MGKKIVCTEEDIEIVRRSDDLTEIKARDLSLMMDHDAIYDLTYRLASYLAFLESQDEEINHNIH